MRVAIDVGGTKTLVVAVDSGGAQLGQVRFATDSDYAIFEKHLLDELRQLISSLNQPLQGIAIAMPGLMDLNTGIVIGFGNRDWKNVAIKQALEVAFDVSVVIDNDANMGALGEARKGSGSGYATVLYITISTGIGTGVTIKGKIDPALAKSEGGNMHFWHDDKLILWEKFASGKAFYERYKKMGKEVPVDDPIWVEYAKDVSIGIGSLLAVIQPEVVVIGGSMGLHLPKYHEELIKNLTETASPIVPIPPIVQATDPDRAVITGCIEALNDKLG